MSERRDPDDAHTEADKTRRLRGVWHSMGIGGLGLVGGALLGIIVQDILATAFFRDRTFPVTLGIAFVFLIPSCAVLGAVVALLIDRQNASRPSGPEGDPR